MDAIFTAAVVRDRLKNFTVAIRILGLGIDVLDLHVLMCEIKTYRPLRILCQNLMSESYVRILCQNLMSES